jgi:hypothetical protein
MPPLSSGYRFIFLYPSLQVCPEDKNTGLACVLHSFGSVSVGTAADFVNTVMKIGAPMKTGDFTD